jgi:ABC-type phosphate transport system substrate-binding protein
MKRVLFGLFMATAFCSTAFADVLIIANKDVPETTLSQQEIQEIFLGKRVQWSDNSRIRFVTVGDAAVHSEFLKQYVKLSEADWKMYWKRMVFTGRGMPPETIATEAELIGFVSKTKGAVGYISSEGMPKKPETDTVKIIGVK